MIYISYQTLTVITQKENIPCILRQKTILKNGLFQSIEIIDLTNNPGLLAIRIGEARII